MRPYNHHPDRLFWRITMRPYNPQPYHTIPTPTRLFWRIAMRTLQSPTQPLNIINIGDNAIQTLKRAPDLAAALAKLHPRHQPVRHTLDKRRLTAPGRN